MEMSSGGPVYLGIDTSNYTTSAAVVSESGEILANSRKLLAVKEGEKGLRQSEALFQHWKVLPELLEPMLSEYRGRIAGVCAGARPRPVKGSYMPVFTAGTGMGRTLAAALGAEYSEISHQEGHFLAAACGSEIDFTRPVLCAHLSGGTLELIYKEGQRYEKVGGTKDISYGQLIDRVGVDLGLPFPAGKYVDELALRHAEKTGEAEPDTALQMSSEGPENPFKRVFKGETYLNLSGLETSLKKALDGLKVNTVLADNTDSCSVLAGHIASAEASQLCFFMMERIAESFVCIVELARQQTGAQQVLVSGGVACSGFLRQYCSAFAFGRIRIKALNGAGSTMSQYVFGRKDLCSDNAAGEALYASGRRL